MTRPIIALLTDYGVGTQHVGALHAVLARECPVADRIDLAHDIPPGDVRWGAIVLERLSQELPGAVYLAVVDPGVGTTRRAIALELDDGSRIVGPDNGLLGLLAPRATSVVRLLSDPIRSATFHGRDLFAPVAARLAAGTPVDDVGAAVPLSSVQVPTIPGPLVGAGDLHAVMVGRDRFGNVALAADVTDLEAAGLTAGEGVTVNGRAARLARTFGDVSPGELLVYIDSNAMVSVAMRNGDAAAELATSTEDTVVIERGGAREN